MKKLILATLILIFGVKTASAQSNKIVSGPLVGDDAGVLTVHNGEAIEIELWVRTDPDNPGRIIGVCHGLMSEDAIIAERNGMDIEPEYDEPYWLSTWVDGPYVYNPEDNFPIPPGWTCELQCALLGWGSEGDPLDTQGEWDLYGTWMMDTNIDVPTGQVYFPFAAGWYPHSGQGTSWAFEAPPGGSVEPEQEYCGLHFVPECIYIVGDCNHNGVPWELSDVISMIGFYRGTVQTPYTCQCPPHDDDFAPGADPNANCVPFELSDVVFMIRPPHWPPVEGCPDCPGSERLVIGESESR